ncbi:hypothetical protein JET18_15590 [Chryseobacterium sp. L7]|uniref:Uncharacterized protein n=1 Tax=Chryseobacterium endalhagicum TaxID=2797638 RepID=A0ABS1QI37_9FLAO|nr:hypothetical protein [Chryseobacterium endalhagicum]MBL1222276.1 hypothetical protein [Chryseobacterium endalhagicum]
MATTDSRITYMSIGDAGAPGPPPPIPFFDAVPGAGGISSAYANDTIKRKRADTSLLIVFILF